MSIHTCTENVEITEKVNATDEQMCIIFFRPPFSQSARKPQINELLTTPVKEVFVSLPTWNSTQTRANWPTKAELFSSPFSVSVSCNSHSISISGMTNPMLSVSTIVDIRHSPDVSSNSAWNRPTPETKLKFKQRRNVLRKVVVCFAFFLLRTSTVSDYASFTVCSSEKHRNFLSLFHLLPASISA